MRTNSRVIAAMAFSLLPALSASSATALAQTRAQGRARATPAPRASERDRAKEQDDRARDDERDLERRSFGITQIAPGVYSSSFGGFQDDRPVMGITTSAGGRRDTLGVLVNSVNRGGPADKAGLEEGDRLVSINGVNLRISPADVDADEMDGIGTRRLQREMRKLKAGDEVDLRIWRDGQQRTVKIKTVESGDLARTSARAMRDAEENRAVLGVNVSSTGSRRDTLGIFVASVTEEGPAEKAGLSEGDRIASINGVDLRVNREDAGDSDVSGVTVNRFMREMRKLKAGDNVNLRVYSGGQTRNLTVKAGRAADLRSSARRFGVGFGDGASYFNGALAPMPPLPPMPPMPAMPPMPRARTYRFDMSDGDELPRAFRFDGGRISEIRVPSVRVPEINIPRIRTPEIDTPDVYVRSFTTPGVRVRSFTTPEIRIDREMLRRNARAVRVEME